MTKLSFVVINLSSYLHIFCAINVHSDLFVFCIFFFLLINIVFVQLFDMYGVNIVGLQCWSD